MTAMKKIWIVWIMLTVACTGRAYEFRMWKNADGSEFEGRFARELFGKLTIETGEGDKKVLEIEDLSDLDKKYLRVMVPPQVKVEIDKKAIEIPPRPALWPRLEKTHKHIVTATITKESQRPFTSRLEAELFLIAEEHGSGENILLSYSKEDFLLMAEKDYTYEARSAPGKTVLCEDLLIRQTRGEVYRGYLLIITSLQGDIVSMSSNLPEWMQQPEVIENLRELWVRGAPSIRSRYFDKTGKKIPPPRPPYIQPWAR